MTEVDAIFNAIGNASKAVIRHDAIVTKRKEIADAKSKTCGHCFHWMKSSCKPEKENGHFKSCNSYACGDFHRTSWTEELIEKRENELKYLDGKGE